jgi:hypothetical protein
MNIARCVVTGTVLLVVAGCQNDRSPSPLTAPANAAAHRQAGEAAQQAGPVQAAGHYDANVDFSTLTLTPRGGNCLLEVDGQLVFTGTITGTAIAHTSALVFAPCAVVAVTPPGTYRDVFTSRAVFDGTVNGETAHAKLLYAGETEVGGTIDAHLIFSNGVAGVLDAVDARVAVGGDYRGAVVVP